MEKNINSKKSLIKVKIMTFCILIIAVSLIAFDKTRLLGGGVALVSLVVEWWLYRCPYCNNSLDPRINLEKNSYCPHCGEKIK